MTTYHGGATAEFPFNGSFVQVFGTIPPANESAPVSNYTLNGTTSQFNRSSLRHVHHNPDQLFYQSPFDLPSGNYTLVIISIQDGAQFTLGTISYDPSFSPSTSSGFPPVLPTPTSSVPSSGNASRKLNVGGIVGGVLAALIVVAALIAFVFLRRRRKQKAAKVKHRAVTPFVTERNSRTSATYAIGTPTLQAPYGSSDEKMSIPVIDPSHLSRHGSTYKPKIDSDGVPPPEFGYGASV
ncbi:hypothetical protein GYMLUDRAFT_81478 [Collybiopsis luxurians FD-317 M1]|nr:hypothetical protein GYMLUDRAFT_81478 [Collybiopsis luxurians FD-317 M1]